MTLHTLGILKDLEYDYLPMPDIGAPLSALQEHLPGLRYLHSRHGLFVESIDDDDSTMDLTRHWRYIPIPLVWLIRLTHIKLPPGVPGLSEDTAQWWFTAIAKKFVPHQDADWDPNETVDYHEHFEDEDEEFKTLLKTLLDSVNLVDFKAKVIPRGSEWSLMESNLNTEPTLIDGKLYIETSEGLWLPQSTEDNATSFWDNSEEDDGIYGDLWDL